MRSIRKSEMRMQKYYCPTDLGMRAFLYMPSRKYGRGGRDWFLIWYCSVVYLYMLCIQWINNGRVLLLIRLSNINTIDTIALYQYVFICSMKKYHYSNILCMNCGI